MNSASAEPERERGVGPVQQRRAGSSLFGAASPAAMASAFSVLNVSNESFTAAKMLSQPPSCVGR